MPPPISSAFHQSLAPTSAHIRHQSHAQTQHHLYHRAPPTPPPQRTERDILLSHHRFLRGVDTAEGYEASLAARYDAALYKEFALISLARWRAGEVAMRWRTAEEVKKGKGESVCAGLECKGGVDGEREVLFEYVEEGEEREAMVKVRLCGACLEKLRRAQGGDKSKERRRERRGEMGDSRSSSKERGESKREGSRPKEMRRAEEDGEVADAASEKDRPRRKRHERSRSPREREHRSHRHRHRDPHRESPRSRSRHRHRHQEQNK